MVARLIAMGLLAEIAVQSFAGQNTSAEWHKGGDQATGVLLLSDQDVDDWIERLSGDFALGLG